MERYFIKQGILCYVFVIYFCKGILQHKGIQHVSVMVRQRLVAEVGAADGECNLKIFFFFSE